MENEIDHNRRLLKSPKDYAYSKWFKHENGVRKFEMLLSETSEVMYESRNLDHLGYNRGCLEHFSETMQFSTFCQPFEAEMPKIGSKWIQNSNYGHCQDTNGREVTIVPCDRPDKLSCVYYSYPNQLVDTSSWSLNGFYDHFTKKPTNRLVSFLKSLI